MKDAKPKRKPAQLPGKPSGGRIAELDGTTPRKDIKQTASTREMRRKKLVEIAKKKLEGATFNKDGFREINKPLHDYEWDFSKVPMEERQLALFWEQRRDRIEFYHRLTIEEADGRRTPSPIPGDLCCMLFWGLNWELFPLPYMEARRYLEMELSNIKFCSMPEIPAFSEIDIGGVATWLENPANLIWRDICQIGSKHFFEKYTKDNFLQKCDGSLSVHCFQINWDKPKKEIWESFRKWVREMKMDRKKIEVSEGRLYQLGVARAKRAGLNAKEFGGRYCGKKNRKNTGQKSNLYDDPGSFYKAAKIAEYELSKIQGPHTFEGSVR